MTIIENKTMDAERALYGSDGVLVRGCAFDGPADGRERPQGEPGRGD